MPAPDDRGEVRVHIIGLAGSGKTTLARWIGDTFDLPVHDLDWIAYDQHQARPPAEVERRTREIADSDAWVTEGAYQDRWIEPLLSRATTIVWLDVPLHVCLYRMLKRHAFAEIARNNQHPGWAKLIRFMNYTRESAKMQQCRATELLRPHESRVIHCRTSVEVSRIKETLARQYSRPRPC
jgi:adenylate kinase family enzyme